MARDGCFACSERRPAAAALLSAGDYAEFLAKNPSRTPPWHSFRTPPRTSPACWRSSARARSMICSMRSPRSSRRGRSGVPPALCEMEVGRLVTERAAGDGRPLNFIGAGAYEHHIPAPVWAIATRGEFYSAYTPYQAEASQGTLQLIYEYQSMMCAPDGHGGVERLAVRRRLGAGGGLSHGGARQSRLELAAHSHAAHRESHLPQGGAVHRRQSRTSSSRAWISTARRGACRSKRCARTAAQDVTALVVQQPNFFGSSGRGRCAHRLGAREQDVC